METTTTIDTPIEDATPVVEFKAPKSAEDFLTGQDEIEHTFPNGKKVKYLLLKSGKVATVFEGTGADVESATLESSGDKSKYMTAIMAAVTKIDGKRLASDELSQLSMKDYMSIQIAVTSLNF